MSNEKMHERQQALAIALTETVVKHIGEDLDSNQAVDLALGWAVGFYFSESKKTPEEIAELVRVTATAIQEAGDVG